MTKEIKILVKGKYGVGKTTFINAVRDILKKNKKFKELFEGYEFDVYEFATDEEKENQAATSKKWTITDGKFEEQEFMVISYQKSFFRSVWSFILRLVKWIIKLFIK